MALELEGKVFQILAEESGISNQSNKPWRKQSFVIETEEQYPKKVCFTSWNDTTDGIKVLRVGEKVRISFRVESREYQNKWFTDVVAWKITKIIEETVSNRSNSQNTNESIYESENKTSQNQQINNTTSKDNVPDPFVDNTEEKGDDLPF